MRLDSFLLHKLVAEDLWGVYDGVVTDPTKYGAMMTLTAKKTATAKKTLPPPAVFQAPADAAPQPPVETPSADGAATSEPSPEETDIPAEPDAPAETDALEQNGATVADDPWAVLPEMTAPAVKVSLPGTRRVDVEKDTPRVIVDKLKAAFALYIEKTDALPGDASVAVRNRAVHEAKRVQVFPNAVMQAEFIRLAERYCRLRDGERWTFRKKEGKGMSLEFTVRPFEAKTRPAATTPAPAGARASEGADAPGVG